MSPAALRPWLWPSAAAALFGALWAAGRTVYWGDLTYIHYPWRALAAQELAVGRPPLWNPYVYLGMPLAGQMQGAAWYPGTVPFYLFGFETSLALYLAVHFGLAGLLAYLWLRRVGLGGPAALGGAAVYAGCGLLASRVVFLNHLSTLALLPGLLLFARHPWLIGLTAALAFLSGYPLMLAGGAAAAFLLTWALGRTRPRVADWAAGAALALALCALLLLPAIELAAGSHRGAGMPLSEILEFALEPRDLPGFIAPWLAPAGVDAATQWWRACWFGLAASLAGAFGFARLGPRARWFLAAYALAALALALGASNPLSRWLWETLPPLKLVRDPGNMTYLLLPAAALVVAAGLDRRRYGGALAALIAAELLVYGLLSQPTAPRPFFTDAGPLARTLQRELRGERYLLSPKALEWTRGRGATAEEAAVDLKRRFYGLTNVPFRVASATGFGEPLVPQPNYAVMDFLYTRSSMEAAAAFLPWVGARLLLTGEPYPEGSLRYLGRALWHGYASRAHVGGAFWLPEDEGSRIPADLNVELPSLDRALPVRLYRSAAWVRAQGNTPEGWLYLAEPRTAGWEARLDGAVIATEPAFGAFQKLRVPEGDWTLDLRYRPGSWRIGLLITALAVLASAAYWYNRARKSHPAA
ncbi:MAG: hypothetical protein HY553_18070 [Elusimicrobia bacterium]|nr:hypothetical protein [Elusimicrobiota bacterium]